MIKAIHNGSTDGIGLGRPICEEPHLPRLFLEGKAHSAIASKLDYNDFGTWIPFAGTQLRRLGFGLPTVDSANEKVMIEYKEELKVSTEDFWKKLEDEGIINSGYPRFGSPKLPWELEYGIQNGIVAGSS